MFDNVLVGVDGRPGGDDAVALARQLAAPGAQVTLANIYGEAGWPPGSGLFVDEQRTESVAFLENEHGRWPGAETACACAPTVGRGLHELAVQRSADLLVVGSTHRGLPGKVLVGDDTRAAFNGAPCAIAIAPHGFALADRPLTRIGVGYNDTPESHRALEAARAIAAHTAAAITVMWVLSPEDVRQRAPLPADWPSATAALIDQTQRELDKLPGIYGVAVSGGTREELAKLGEDVDVLIVGSRGHGRFGGIVHGSVSSYLERHVGAALLVLPRPPSATSPGDPEQHVHSTAAGV